MPKVKADKKETTPATATNTPTAIQSDTAMKSDKQTTEVLPDSVKKCDRTNAGLSLPKETSAGENSEKKENLTVSQPSNKTEESAKKDGNEDDDPELTR